MDTFDFLNSSEIKDLFQKIEFFYKSDTKNLLNYKFYINRNNGKVYLSNIQINLDDLNINSNKIAIIGVYFGTFHEKNRFRLSIEGSKFVSPQENYVELDENYINKYIAAKDLDINEVRNINHNNNCSFLIVKYNNENLGCVTLKNDKLLNYIPKARRLQEDKVF